MTKGIFKVIIKMIKITLSKNNLNKGKLLFKLDSWQKNESHSKHNIWSKISNWAPETCTIPLEYKKTLWASYNIS